MNRVSATERPLAPAVIVGAAKGLLAGVGLALVPALLMFSSSPLDEVGRVVAGFALGGASVCGLDAASMRVEPVWGRRGLRFLAGFLLPLALMSPQFTIFSAGFAAWATMNLLELLGILALLGAALGMGFVAAGEPEAPPHRPQGCVRLLIALFATVGLVAVANLMLGSWRGLAEAVGAGLLGGVFVAGAFWAAQNVAALVLPPLALWLEPGVDIDARDDARSVVLGEIELVERCLRVTGDDESVRRTMTLQEALDALDRLAERGPVPALGVSPPTLALKRAEVLIALGRLDEAEKLAATAREGPAVEAEVARRRGDPERSAEIATRWLESVKGDRSFAAQTALGSAFALLALARAEQGRFDEAAASLASLRGVAAWHARAFRHLNSEAVAARIVQCRARAASRGQEPA